MSFLFHIFCLLVSNSLTLANLNEINETEREHWIKCPNVSTINCKIRNIKEGYLYRNRGCKSIHRPLSYPFRSLYSYPVCPGWIQAGYSLRSRILFTVTWTLVRWFHNQSRTITPLNTISGWKVWTLNFMDQPIKIQ